jgi:hypothetical protein
MCIKLFFPFGAGVFENQDFAFGGTCDTSHLSLTTVPQHSTNCPVLKSPFSKGFS